MKMFKLLRIIMIQTTMGDLHGNLRKAILKSRCHNTVQEILDKNQISLGPKTFGVMTNNIMKKHRWDLVLGE